MGLFSEGVSSSAGWIRPPTSYLIATGYTHAGEKVESYSWSDPVTHALGNFHIIYRTDGTQTIREHTYFLSSTAASSYGPLKALHTGYIPPVPPSPAAPFIPTGVRAIMDPYLEQARELGIDPGFDDIMQMRVALAVAEGRGIHAERKRSISEALKKMSSSFKKLAATSLSGTHLPVMPPTPPAPPAPSSSIVMHAHYSSTPTLTARDIKKIKKTFENLEWPGV